MDRIWVFIYLRYLPALLKPLTLQVMKKIYINHNVKVINQEVNINSNALDDDY